MLTTRRGAPKRPAVTPAALYARVSTTGQARRPETHLPVMAHRWGGEAARERVAELQGWCLGVAARLTRLDHAAKQLALDALGVSVAVYQRDRSPRYVITARIPLAPEGAAPTDLDP